LGGKADLLGSGWNVTQSMIAVGSGGVFGKGFLQGTQSKLRFLPESHTDFIAAVFLEERGLVGGCVLLVLYVLLLWGILRIGDKSEGFGKLICYGISAIFFFHIVINVGMVTVPDSRLDELSKIINPQRVQNATVEFVDIAGLVEGAAKGEGLGNKFLSNIRTTAAICQV